MGEGVGWGSVDLQSTRGGGGGGGGVRGSLLMGQRLSVGQREGAAWQGGNGMWMGVGLPCLS